VHIIRATLATRHHVITQTTTIPTNLTCENLLSNISTVNKQYCSPTTIRLRVTHPVNPEPTATSKINDDLQQNFRTTPIFDTLQYRMVQSTSVRSNLAVYSTGMSHIPTPSLNC